MWSGTDRQRVEVLWETTMFFRSGPEDPVRGFYANLFAEREKIIPRA